MLRQFASGGPRREFASRSPIALGVFLSLTAWAAPAQNLILNSSFEDPAFAGTHLLVPSGSPVVSHWDISGPGNTVIHHAPDAGNATGNPTFNFAHHGDSYLDLSGDGSPHALVSQSFSTSIGQPYELSFWIGASNQQAVAATIHVQLDGAASLLSTILTPSAPSVNIDWTLQTFSFVADSTTTVLGFQGLSSFDDNASFVDSVSIVAVPEPLSGWMLVLGALLLRRRGPA